MTFAQLSQRQLDALREISNIGMGHGATALSQLLGETVLLRVPQVTVTEISRVPELLGGAEEEVVGIHLKVLGDARGQILLIFPAESAKRLLSCLLGTEVSTLILDELATSTLMEVGNILASAYLSALGSLLHMTLIPSVPHLASDMAGAVVDQILIDLSETGDTALLMETEFHGQQCGAGTVNGNFLLLPDPESLETMLSAIGAAP